jgi:hypothetical protein
MAVLTFERFRKSPHVGARRPASRALDRGVREWEAREVEWKALPERLQRAFDAEHNARVALIACRPRSEQEAVAKATHLAEQSAPPRLTLSADSWPLPLQPTYITPFFRSGSGSRMAP